MSTPTPDQVRVATDTLRTEADVWERQARAVADAGARASTLGLTRLEAGMFQLLVDAYRAVQDQVTHRCDEGRRALHDVATTLRETADTYDHEDAAHAHRLHDLY